MTEASPAERFDVFTRPDLLVQLFSAERDVGYKLVTFYTASATIYIAMVGFALQQYFAASTAGHAGEAAAIAWIGLVIGMMSLSAPVGLAVSRREIEKRVSSYSDALGLPRERFTIVRFGGSLSAVVFAAICAGWAVALLRT